MFLLVAFAVVGVLLLVGLGLRDISRAADDDTPTDDDKE